MRTVYKFFDPEGREVDPIPYEKHYVLEVSSVRLTPSIGDPEDPNDDEELEITYVIEEGHVK